MQGSHPRQKVLPLAPRLTSLELEAVRTGVGPVPRSWLPRPARPAGARRAGAVDGRPPGSRTSARVPGRLARGEGAGLVLAAAPIRASHDGGARDECVDQERGKDQQPDDHPEVARGAGRRLRPAGLLRRAGPPLGHRGRLGPGREGQEDILELQAPRPQELQQHQEDRPAPKPDRAHELVVLRRAQRPLGRPDHGRHEVEEERDQERRRDVAEQAHATERLPLHGGREVQGQAELGGATTAARTQPRGFLELYPPVRDRGQPQ
mmetsp:Transcript_44796/g.139386  ORF Transcript_44796/g.139386 Transcript_44796/m.139386 type:complete len:264 (+) Transcript_44796:294-1085(+)